MTTWTFETENTDVTWDNEAVRFPAVYGVARYGVSKYGNAVPGEGSWSLDDESSPVSWTNETITL